MRNPYLKKYLVMLTIGWYVVTPPVINHEAVTSFPLSTWKTSSAYPTLQECEDFLTEALHNSVEDYKRSKSKSSEFHSLNGLDETMIQLWGASFCMASDDPRLKVIQPDSVDNK